MSLIIWLLLGAALSTKLNPDRSKILFHRTSLGLQLDAKVSEPERFQNIIREIKDELGTTIYSQDLNKGSENSSKPQIQPIIETPPSDIKFNDNFYYYSFFASIGIICVIGGVYIYKKRSLHNLYKL
ncbi:unnamed protein product [Blepharisma stoltei]|uniref:Uncharacterized protein n=1 Tax=Blepharisma stoltei TaxID=1481888 RepID=A0AAU9K7K6_9CILI|nr:unnamed protein product [Blepharisma stoltei]